MKTFLLIPLFFILSMPILSQNSDFDAIITFYSGKTLKIDNKDYKIKKKFNPIKLKRGQTVIFDSNNHIQIVAVNSNTFINRIKTNSVEIIDNNKKTPLSKPVFFHRLGTSRGDNGFYFTEKTADGESDTLVVIKNLNLFVELNFNNSKKLQLFDKKNKLKKSIDIEKDLNINLKEILKNIKPGDYYFQFDKGTHKNYIKLINIKL